MKSLIWKEWREIRLIPAAVVGLFLAVNLVWMLLKYPVPGAARSNDLFGAFNMTGCLFLGAASFLLAGVLSASSSFCGEIGSNSISFLTALPLSRMKIWAAKVAAGLFSLLLSIVGASIAAVAVLAIYAHTGAPKADIVTFQSLDDPMRGLYDVLRAAILASIGCFAVSLTVSLLVDRALTSAALSIIASLVVGFILSVADVSPAANWMRTVLHSNSFVWIAPLQVLLLFFATSYYIFAHGETLRTNKRFALLGKAVGSWAAANAAALIAACLYFTFWL